MLARSIFARQYSIPVTESKRGKATPMPNHDLDWLHKPKTEEESRFLSGSRDHDEELASAGRIFLEFVRGFSALNLREPCVTVFGSARFPESHEYYDLAYRLGHRLAEEGFAVVTGGGPGIMEAANRGAKEAGGLSIGCNIRLPEEQKPNPYLDRFVEFEQAFVVMPGGLGTLDEAFEAAVLMQTRKIESFPIVAMGGSFWESMRDFIRNTLLAEGTINESDLDLITLADSVDEAVATIRQHEGV
jgi:uncharacterized protein (TIGR00730 family)